MEIMTILNNKPKEKIYGLMGNINLTTNNTNISIVTSYKFGSTVKDYLNSPKDISSLKMVYLNETYLPKKIEELSESEIKKVNLAKTLITNPEIIVLNYFEKGLTNKEQKDYQRLFKKLSNDYHKTILIYTNDISFIWNLTKEIIYVDKNEVINTYSSDDVPSINIPPIKEFITLIRNKNINIDDYKETSDLLKAIYRIKESNNEIPN